MTHDMADERQVDDDGTDESPEEIRADIEETREEMGGTLDELGERLDPNRLMNDAKQNVRDATIGRVEGAVGAAEQTAKGATDKVMDTIRRNPIPSAMVGIGALMLWRSRSETSFRGSHPQRPAVTQKVSGAARDVASTAGDAASQAAQQGRATIDEVGSQLDRMMQASPLALGAVAVGAGALVGALLPDTPQEREMLGDASHQVASTVRDTVSQALDKVEEQADRAEEAVASKS
jgi:ElaB/YqjD/DUF883 family membrane-anchored ribosome-binding protein